MNQKTILLVEDEAITREATLSFLESHNFKVSLAATAEEALREADLCPDLILIDRILPDGDGIEVCRRIRENKRLWNIPIIMLTVRNSIAEKIEGLNVGADDYMTKPFNAEELLARIRANLRRSRFQEQDENSRNDLIEELKKIIDQKLIEPHFQPIVDLNTFAPLGFEVLSRSSLSELLNTPDLLFKISLAGDMYFQLEMVCWEQGFKKWKSFNRPEKVFLNCAPSFIENKNFTPELLIEKGFKIENIVLEITERICIQNYGLFFKKVDELKKRGLKVAVDDIGSGFASLDMIAQTRPDFVKIDMFLVRDIHRDTLKQSIIEAIINFCRNGKIATIAEGVESQEELQQLIKMGVDAAQGYYLAKPAPGIAPGKKD